MQVAELAVTRGSVLVRFSSDAFAAMGPDAAVSIDGSEIASARGSTRVASLGAFAMRLVAGGDVNVPMLNVKAPR